MKVTAATVFDLLSRLRANFKMITDARDYDDDGPFRSELYSSEQLNSHAIAIAGAHRLQATRTADQLLKTLADNEHTLRETRNLLVTANVYGDPFIAEICQTEAEGIRPRLKSAGWKYQFVLGSLIIGKKHLNHTIHGKLNHL